MNDLTPALLPTASFCESVEAAHSDHSTNSRIATLLGIEKQSVRMDSQAKYCSIARGDGDIYLRLPVSITYEEKIWVTPPFPFVLMVTDSERVRVRIILPVHSWSQKQVD